MARLVLYTKKGWITSKAQPEDGLLLTDPT